MIKKHSWTRHQYDDCYEKMRRGITFDELIKHWPMPDNIIKAADYSYQAHGYWISGWSSDLRRERFYAIKRRILTQTEDIPF